MSLAQSSSAAIIGFSDAVAGLPDVDAIAVHGSVSRIWISPWILHTKAIAICPSMARSSQSRSRRHSGHLVEFGCGSEHAGQEDVSSPDGCGVVLGGSNDLHLVDSCGYEFRADTGSDLPEKAVADGCPCRTGEHDPVKVEKIRDVDDHSAQALAGLSDEASGLRLAAPGELPECVEEVLDPAGRRTETMGGNACVPSRR